MVLDALDDLIVRMADEGVPIGAIARISAESAENIRPILRSALTAGRLVELPREDWPAAIPRYDRRPQLYYAGGSRGRIKHPVSDDDTILLAMAEVFKATRLQAKVLLRLLRRGHCPKGMLHDAVEENRGHPEEPTGDKIVQVMICHLRKKLTPFDISITTHHGSGYSMTIEDRQRVVQLLAGSVKCPEEQLNIGLDI